MTAPTARRFLVCVAMAGVAGMAGGCTPAAQSGPASIQALSIPADSAPADNAGTDSAGTDSATPDSAAGVGPITAAEGSGGSYCIPATGRHQFVLGMIGLDTPSGASVTVDDVDFGSALGITRIFAGLTTTAPIGVATMYPPSGTATERSRWAQVKPAPATVTAPRFYPVIAGQLADGIARGSATGLVVHYSVDGRPYQVTVNTRITMERGPFCRWSQPAAAVTSDRGRAPG